MPIPRSHRDSIARRWLARRWPLRGIAMLRCIAVLATTTLWLSSPNPVLAQDAVAQSLFDEGKRLLKAGKTAAACEKFAASEAAKASTGALLNLASCHLKLGKTATAWAEFKRAIPRARADGRQDRIDYAEEQVAALEPLLSRVTLIAPEALTRVDGLQVALDDAVVPQVSFGLELPIDPGSHAIRVSASRHKTWSRTFTITGNRQRETVRLPLLQRLKETVAIRIGRLPVVSGLVVRIDGTVLDAAALRDPIEVAPGTHTITAAAPDHGTWSKRLTLDEAGESLSVDVPDLREGQTTPPASGDSYLDSHSSPALAPRNASRRRGSTTNYVAIAGLGLALVGAGSAAGGIVAGVVARNRAQQAVSGTDLCPSYQCSERGWDYVVAAKKNALLADILIPSGSALFVVGVGMMVLSGGSSGSSGTHELPTVYYAGDEFGVSYETQF